MLITVDPLVLLTVLAFLVPWAAVRLRVRCWWFKARLELARRRMQWKFKATILVHTGHINRGATVRLARKVRETPRGSPIVLVIDTCGGEMPAAQHLLRCLSDHSGQVIVRVPDECWSAGSVIACAADLLILGRDANLGPTDSIAPVDPSEIRTGPTTTAHMQGLEVGLVRARHAQSAIVEAITAARVKRGDDPVAARGIAERLTCSDVDHHEPFFVEDVRALGLPVAVDSDPAWFHLVHLSSWTR